jgi:hypothetical protein
MCIVLIYLREDMVAFTCETDDALLESFTTAKTLLPITTRPAKPAKPRRQCRPEFERLQATHLPRRRSKGQQDTRWLILWASPRFGCVSLYLSRSRRSPASLSLFSQ